MREELGTDAGVTGTAYGMQQTYNLTKAPKKLNAKRSKIKPDHRSTVKPQSYLENHRSSVLGGNVKQSANLITALSQDGGCYTQELFNHPTYTSQRA